MFAKSHNNGITRLQPLNDQGKPEGKPIKIIEPLGEFLKRMAADDFAEAVNNCQS